VVPSFCLRSSLLLFDDDVITLHGKPGVGVPVIGIIKASGFCVLKDQGDERVRLSVRNRKDNDFPVSLVKTEHDMFSRGSPASFAFPMAAIHGFIHLDLTGQSHLLKLFHRVVIKGFSEKSVDPLGRLERDRKIHPAAVRGNTQDKQVQQMGKLVEGDFQLLQTGPGKITEFERAARTLETSFLELINFTPVKAVRTVAFPLPSISTKIGLTFRAVVN